MIVVVLTVRLTVEAAGAAAGAMPGAATGADVVKDGAAQAVPITSTLHNSHFVMAEAAILIALYIGRSRRDHNSQGKLKTSGSQSPATLHGSSEPARTKERDDALRSAKLAASVLNGNIPS